MSTDDAESKQLLTAASYDHPYGTGLVDSDGASGILDDAYSISSVSAYRTAVTDESLSAKETFAKKIKYYVPVLGWLPKYKWQFLINDAVAALATSALLLPQAISYSGLARLSPNYGLYASFTPLIVYSILGTSRELGAGPDALLSILTGQAIEPLAEPGDEQALVDLAQVLALLVGIITLALGFFRLGFLDSVLSRATNRGFITAVALVILIEQLPPILGYHSKFNTTDTPIQKFIWVWEHTDEFNYIAFVLAVITLVIIMGHKLLKSYFKSNKRLSMIFLFTPVLLLHVIAMTAISWGFDLESYGITIIGNVTKGFETPRFPPINSENFVQLIVPAFVISVCGFIQSIVIAKEFANKQMYSVSDNRELVAFGSQNVLGCIFGAYPCFASPPRTVVNSEAGSKSQISIFLTSLIMLMVILFLIDLFATLPKCVASAIVITAAIGLIDFADMLFLWKIRAYSDIFLMLFTLLATLILGISAGVFLALIISLVLVVKVSTLPTYVSLLGETSPEHYVDVDKIRSGRLSAKYLLFSINSPLFFANTAQIKDRLHRAELYGSIRTHPAEEGHGMEQLVGVIFDLDRMVAIDASSLQVFIEIIQGYHFRDVRVLFCRIHDGMKAAFDKSGISDMVGQQSYFNKLSDAVASLEQQQQQLLQ